jgi:hypothetical protein
VFRPLGDGRYHVRTDDEEYADQVRAYLWHFKATGDLQGTIRKFVEQRRGWLTQEAKLIATAGGKARGKNVVSPPWRDELFAEAHAIASPGRKKVGPDSLADRAVAIAEERAKVDTVWKERLPDITRHHASRWLTMRCNENSGVAEQVGDSEPRAA